MLSVKIRHGVPVFRRMISKPYFFRLLDNSELLFSPSGPSYLMFSPLKMREFIYTPVVIIVTLEVKLPLFLVLTPRHFWFLTIKSITSSSIKVIFFCFLISSKIILQYLSLSIWARKDQTAAPLDEFNILIWIIALSAKYPCIPPNASISRVIIPLAEPPIDGLQGNIAKRFKLRLINATWKLRFAKA